jgi:hypothetical protein
LVANSSDELAACSNTTPPPRVLLTQPEAPWSTLRRADHPHRSPRTSQAREDGQARHPP